MPLYLLKTTKISFINFSTKCQLPHLKFQLKTTHVLPPRPAHTFPLTFVRDLDSVSDAVRGAAERTATIRRAIGELCCPFICLGFQNWSLIVNQLTRNKCTSTTRAYLTVKNILVIIIFHDSMEKLYKWKSCTVTSGDFHVLEYLVRICWDCFCVQANVWAAGSSGWGALGWTGAAGASVPIFPISI